MFVWVAPSLCAPALSLGSRRNHPWVHHVMMNAALGWQDLGNRRALACACHTLTPGGLCSACVHTAEEKQELISFAD